MKAMHLLDNPIYNALNSGHRIFSEGNAAVKYYLPEVASFAGFQEYDAAHFDALYKMSRPGCLYIVFSVPKLIIPEQWKLVTQIDMFQMVYTGAVRQDAPAIGFENLETRHVEAMDALVKLTKPGPFCSRTIELGNYTGIFKDEKLVAMAGHRFFPAPYREISAVCTHPEHLGKGYAFSLMQEQVKRILARGEVPFLHVRNDNLAAVHLYQKLGFEIRTTMIAYVIAH